MRKSTKFSPEVRERAVRMVQEHRGDANAPCPLDRVKRQFKADRPN